MKKEKLTYEEAMQRLGTIVESPKTWAKASQRPKTSRKFARRS